MIAGLKGRVEAKLADALLVDVAGVVYRVGTSATTLAEVGESGEPVRLLTHLFVREDQLTLYGFAHPDELRLFEILIGVTGVGPRLACAILSHFPTDLLYDALAQENIDFLATVPGVGKKTAARLILELRGKVPTGPRTAPGATPASRDDNDVVAALRALGYTVAEAHGAAMRSEVAADATLENKVLAALRVLSEG